MLVMSNVERPGCVLMLVPALAKRRREVWCMRNFMREFMRAMKEGPRIYFAPLVGAFRAIQEECRRR